MRNILIVILLLISKIGMGQLVFKIENITVSNVIETIEDNILWREGFGEGPYIKVDCSITNDDNDTITLFPKNSKIYTVFNFENTKYCVEALYKPISFMKKDSLVIILPNQRFDFSFSDIYLLGTDFYKWSKISLKDIRKIDHTKEVIATLPTLRVRYKDENIDIITDEIKNVTVHW